MAVPVFIFFYAVFVNTGKADLSESVLVPGISAGSVVLNSTVDSVLKAFSGEAYRKVILRGTAGIIPAGVLSGHAV